MEALIALVAAVVGALLGAWVHRVFEQKAAGSVRAEAARLVEGATRDAEHLLKDARVQAKEELYRNRDALESEGQELRLEVKERERRLQKREEVIDQKLDLFSKREGTLHVMEARLQRREQEATARAEEVEALHEKGLEDLSRIARLTRDQAAERLLDRVGRQVEHEQNEVILRTMTRLKAEADKKALHILTTAIQRVATSHASDAMVTSVPLPSEEMKGRIIGREGRNIRAFEKATGTDVIVDDTPGIIVLSSFDGVRREVARRAMETLIQDGRIHPTRIEEVAARAAKEMAEQVREIGKEASIEVDVAGLHDRVLDLLGRLRYRTSYGQNVLRHSVEVAQLCGTLAGELGLNIKLAKRCGLLHDIGKAVDHEQEGGHPAIGAEIGRRYQEPKEVINAIASHHDDCPQESLYAYLVMAADSVSGGRPGARGESLERYVRRLAKLEEVATESPGVRQAYAIQAGREVRVIVNANKVSDKHAAKLARDIARRIEAELTYPGEIKVTLMRETRIIEYAR